MRITATLSFSLCAPVTSSVDPSTNGSWLRSPPAQSGRAECLQPLALNGSAALWLMPRLKRLPVQSWCRKPANARNIRNECAVSCAVLCPMVSLLLRVQAPLTSTGNWRPEIYTAFASKYSQNVSASSVADITINLRSPLRCRCTSFRTANSVSVCTVRSCAYEEHGEVL